MGVFLDYVHDNPVKGLLFCLRNSPFPGEFYSVVYPPRTSPRHRWTDTSHRTRDVRSPCPNPFHSRETPTLFVSQYPSSGTPVSPGQGV